MRVQLPHLFTLEKTTDFQRRRFTSIDGVKYIHIKVIEYHKPISIPLKVLNQDLHRKSIQTQYHLRNFCSIYNNSKKKMVETCSNNASDRSSGGGGTKKTTIIIKKHPTPSTPLLRQQQQQQQQQNDRSDTPHPTGADQRSLHADKEVEMFMMKNRHENIEDAMLFLPAPTTDNNNIRRRRLHDQETDDDDDDDDDYEAEKDGIDDGDGGGGSSSSSFGGFASRKAAGILGGFSSDLRSYVPYVTPSIIRNKRSSKLDKEKRQKFSSDSRELIDHFSKRLSINYRNSMEGLRYSFYKSIMPLKTQCRMTLKLLIYIIFAVAALIMIATALLTIACIATKMASDDDEHHAAHNSPRGTATTINSTTNDGVVRGNVSCIYVTSVLPNCGKTWKRKTPSSIRHGKEKHHHFEIQFPKKSVF